MSLIIILEDDHRIFHGNMESMNCFILEEKVALIIRPRVSDPPYFEADPDPDPT